MLLYTIILSKYVKYTATVILEICKNPDCLSSSSSVQTAYRKTGGSNRFNYFTKIIYTGAYMILDAQNLPPKPSNSRSTTLQVLVLDAIFLFAHVPTREVSFVH